MHSKWLHEVMKIFYDVDHELFVKLSSWVAITAITLFACCLYLGFLGTTNRIVVEQWFPIEMGNHILTLITPSVLK